MCCRYYVNAGIYREVGDLLKEAGSPAKACLPADPLFRPRDIHPSETAPVLLSRQGRLQLLGMQWGFPSADSRNPSSSAGYRGKLLINARAETLLQKPTFAPLALNFRCIIPASLFYEWNPQKEKVRFSWESDPLLCMAGIYRPDPDDFRFAVITTDANESMRPVHDRMPLIFPREAAIRWICRADQTEALLASASPQLKREQDYRQLSLF